MFRFVITLATLSLAIPCAADDLTPEQLKFFEAKIRPVLVRECYGCHSNQAGNVRGGLRLDTKELMLIGGSTGPAIVPGDLEESWLYNAITHQDYVMPPRRKLSDAIIADFRRWIEMGAPDPRTSKVAAIKSSITEEDISKARDTFWAYQKPEKHAPPAVRNTDWPVTPIDHFVLSQLESSDMQPSKDAEAWKVLRRLCFDLNGLPPTPEQIEAFTTAWNNDPSQAIAKMVDRLLQRKQYGERWGRHWLDVARYAESTGSSVNMTYPHAWRYRDYVIDSFNEDKPFNRFIEEQLAGDLLPVDTDEEWTRNLIATSFLAVGPKNVNEQNRIQFAANVVDEQIDATTRVFLGTSVACARCHDHKFDAIPQTDYYALAGIFSNMKTYFGNPPSELGSFASAQAKQNSSLIVMPVQDPNPFDPSYSQSEIADMKAQIADTQREMVAMRRNRNSGTGGANAQRNRIRMLNEIVRVNNKLSVVDEDGNPRSYCMGVQERGPGQDAKLLVRGEIDQAAQSVPRGFPQVLCSQTPDIGGKSGRLDLARWIASEDNPLTARVMVNRIWQHMIGQGLVTSTENFGVTGQPPSHPELLDYLAVRFVESGWSVKQLVRDIATSRAYRMASTFNEENHNRDPDNALLWRANPRRLDAEAIRDAMLSISGEIDFDRPRASEVAKAGYTRVQNGMLANPRDMFRRSGGGQGLLPGRGMQRRDQSGAGRGMQRGGQNARQGRPGAGRTQQGTGRGVQRGGQNSGGRSRFGQGRPGQGGSRFGQRSRGSQRGGTMEDMQAAIRRVTHQLDMEHAKFRSVYLPIVRDEEPRAMHVFDYNDSSSVVGTRESSNTADQALYLMNNPFVIQQSQAFARRISAASTRPSEQLEQAFLLAWGRKPTSGERAAALAFARSYGQMAGSGPETMTAICQSLFAAAEFRFID